MHTLISVVIPIYNQEKYLGECLNSLFPQCTDEVEVVLVNDGSKDRSLDICKEFISRYPNVKAKLIDQENSGSYKSRLNGIKNSSGDYIQFVDSDDILLEHALETVLEVLHDRIVDMVLFNATCDLSSKKPYFTIPLESGRELTGEYRYQVYRLLCETPVLNNLWTKCIRRDLFKWVSHPADGQKLTNGEDLYMILDLADNASSFVYLDCVLYYYRIMTDSISRVYNPHYFASEKTVCSKRLEYAKKWSRNGELVPGASVQTFKIMREIARKVLISDMSWKKARAEMRKLRTDSFFRRYYLKVKSNPDRKYRVLKAPYPVMHAARILRSIKKGFKR